MQHLPRIPDTFSPMQVPEKAASQAKGRAQDTCRQVKDSPVAAQQILQEGTGEDTGRHTESPQGTCREPAGDLQRAN